jgi:hypothetical protein
VENNVIVENSAGMGGALAFCDGTIQSNLIAENTSDSQGGAMARCDAVILNNTVCDNSAVGDGGGIYNTIGTVVNCIVWGNVASGSGSQVYDAGTISFSCVQGWTGGGAGNIGDSPAFRNPKGGDFHLLAGSPCIDAGDSSVLTSPALDMDGNLRIALGEQSLVVDMGAYEYGAQTFGITRVGIEENDVLRLTWNSQPNDTYTLWTCTDLLSGEWLIEKKLTIPSEGGTTSWSLPVPFGALRLYKIGIR